jgi:hypothetical protein
VNVLQVLAYDMLSRQLDIPALRQLEDFLITDCFYAGGSLAVKQLHISNTPALAIVCRSMGHSVTAEARTCSL